MESVTCALGKWCAVFVCAIFVIMNLSNVCYACDAINSSLVHFLAPITDSTSPDAPPTDDKHFKAKEDPYVSEARSDVRR